MYSFSSAVRYSECDEHANLSLVGIINYLQDCSTFHSESLGHGLQYMTDHHFAWFISAWQIQIERLPRFNQRITVSTNPWSMERVLAHRNFSITDEDGDYLVKADSLWFTFDTQAGKPCRIPQHEADVYQSSEPPLDLPKTQRRILVEGEGRRMSPIVVNEQHLDTNHHVNNAQYVAMADALVRELEPDFDLYRILVSYKQMALLGDVIVPRVHQAEKGYVVDLANEDGDSFAVVSLEHR